MKDKYSVRLELTHVTGDKLNPVMIKCSKTGVLGFKLVEIGKDKADAISVIDEKEMMHMVTKLGYRVRAANKHSASGRSGLYQLEGPSITCYRVSKAA